MAGNSFSTLCCSAPDGSLLADCHVEGSPFEDDRPDTLAALTVLEKGLRK
jgi:hypothetical protein